MKLGVYCEAGSMYFILKFCFVLCILFCYTFYHTNEIDILIQKVNITFRVPEHGRDLHFLKPSFSSDRCYFMCTFIFYQRPTVHYTILTDAWVNQICTILSKKNNRNTLILSVYWTGIQIQN